MCMRERGEVKMNKTKKKIKYVFGVMSCKYSLEAEDKGTAYICMCLFIDQNIPIAVYSPLKDSFMPLNVLEKNKSTFDKDKFDKCMITIRKVSP